MRILHRLAAVTLCLALLAGNAVICAGWAPTPEARMTCCVGGGTCPMHKGDSHHGRTVTQAQADSCCASSEGDPSDSSSAPAVTLRAPAVLGTGVVIVSALDRRLPGHGWLLPPATRVAPVPRHLLLSVFLV